MIIKVKNFSELKSHLSNSKEYSLRVKTVSNFCIPVKANKHIDYWFDWTLEDCTENKRYSFTLDKYSKDFADFITKGNITIKNKEIFCYLLYLGYKLINTNFSSFDVMMAKSKYFGIFNYVLKEDELESQRNSALNVLRPELPFSFSDEKTFDAEVKTLLSSVLYKDGDIATAFSVGKALRDYKSLRNNEDELTKYIGAISKTKRILRYFRKLDFLDYIKMYGNCFGSLNLERTLKLHDVKVNSSKEYLLNIRLEDIILHYYECKIYNNHPESEEDFYNNILNRYPYLKEYLDNHKTFCIDFTRYALKHHVRLNEYLTSNNSNKFEENDNLLAYKSSIKYIMTLAIYSINNRNAFEDYISKYDSTPVTKNLIIRFVEDYFTNNEVYKTKAVMYYILKTIFSDLAKRMDNNISLFYSSTTGLVFKVSNNVHPSIAYRMITDSLSKELPLIVKNCVITHALNDCFTNNDCILNKDFFDYLSEVHPNKLHRVVNDVYRIYEKYDKLK